MTSRLARLAGSIVDLQRIRPAFPHLDVTDFGAVGNRSANDQTALENACAEAVTTGLPVYLPPGGYVHDARLTVDGVTLFSVVPDAAALLGPTVEEHAIDLTGTGPELHNLVIRGPKKAPRTSGRGGNGVYINAATGHVVRGCRVSDVSGAGIMTEFSSGGLVRGNHVSVTGADGIYTTEGTHTTEIAYNRMVVTGDDAVGVASYPSGGMTYDLTIHHNACLGNYESRGITVNGGDNIIIRDNHIDGGTAGITACCSTSAFGTLQTTDVEAYGNTIRNINQARQNTGTIGGGAIHLWNDLAGADSGINVHDNQVVAPGLHGIYVGGSGSITASVVDNDFWMDAARTLYLRDGGGTGTVTQTGNTRALPAAYPGDLVPATVGGIDTTYRYAPT